MLKINKDLQEIGETYQSLTEFNEMANIYTEKHFGASFSVWYINKKGWQMLSYVNDNGCTQLCAVVGLNKLETLFDSPITTINNFFKTFNINKNAK